MILGVVRECCPFNDRVLFIIVNRALKKVLLSDTLGNQGCTTGCRAYIPEQNRVLSLVM